MSNTDYNPRNQRTRNDKPRFVDDEDEDYPKARRSRYDDPSTYSDPRAAAREAFRGHGSDVDDDPRSDKDTRAAPRSGAARGNNQYSGRDAPEPRSGGKENFRRQERNPRDDERSSRPSRKARDTYEDEEDDRPSKIQMHDLEAPRRGKFDNNHDDVIATAEPRGAGEPDRIRGYRYDGKGRERDGRDEPEQPRRRPRERDPYDEPEPQRRREKNRDPYEEPEPPRRRTNDGERERRHRDDRDDDQDDSPRPPRRRREDDRNDDRGYRSDGRDLERRRNGGREDEKGYRSDGRGMVKERRDGQIAVRDDRRDKGDRRDDGRDRYGPDKRDRVERDRKDREKEMKKKGFSLNAKDVQRYVETGQKHYQTAKPIIDSLAKMYLDSKR